MQNVPLIEGKPAAWVSVTVEDKINIGNFQNVTFTATVGRFTQDEDKNISAELKHLSGLVEPFLAEQRQEVLIALSEQ